MADQQLKVFWKFYLPFFRSLYPDQVPRQVLEPGPQIDQAQIFRGKRMCC